MNFRFRIHHLVVVLVLLGLCQNPLRANVGGMPAAGGVQVAALSPSDMAVDVAPNTPVTVEFGGAINPAFYQSINVNLFQGGKPIDGELFYNPNARQVMFKPKTSLAEGQSYTAQVSFTDGTGGNAEKAWSFRIKGNNASPMSQVQDAWLSPKKSSGVQVAAAGPMVVSPTESQRLSIMRANMAAGALPLGSSMEITFSEPLDLGSLKEAPIKLYYGKELLGVDYKLSKDLKTLTLVSRNLLRPGPGYSVAIGQQLAGSSGARLTKNTLIPFRIVEGDLGTEVPNHVIEEAPPEPQAAAPRPNYNPFGQAQGGQGYELAPGYAAPAPMPMARAPEAMPLKIVGLSPRNGEAIQNLSQPVAVGFNTEVRPETLNEFTFRIEDDFGPVPAKIKYYAGRKQAVLTPVGVLDAQKSYRVVLTTGITDLSGRPLSAPFSSAFATAAPMTAPMAGEEMVMRPAPRKPAKQRPMPAPTAPMFTESEAMRDSKELEVVDDEASEMEEKPLVRQAAYQMDPPVKRVPPKKERLTTFKITGIKPSANSERVPRNSKILVQFSEPAHPATVNNINISIFGNQKRVEGRVSYDNRNQRALFIPSEPFAAETQYKVVLSDKIRSMGGEPLIGRYSWQFTTDIERKGRYNPRGVVEADAEFSIPLLDRQVTRKPQSVKRAGETSATPSFTYLPQSHWVFKGIRKMVQKGLLTTYPFQNQTKVSRYECAMSINGALNTLKGMQGAGQKARLKMNDLIELEHLVVEFKQELRSIGSDSSWLEGFLEEQGVKISEIESRVAALNSRS